MTDRLWGIVTTYRRPAVLADTVAKLARQTRRLDVLVVVDNGAGSGGVSEVDLAHAEAAGRVVVLPQPHNVGPAGGVAAGMQFVLEHGDPDDWLVTLDDDDPPLFVDDLERLRATAAELLARDPRLAAIGVNGARFDPRRCRYERLPDSELSGGPVLVCSIGGGQLPLMRVEVVREVGTFRPDLFFGHEELEFFLRVQASGWHTYVDSALLLRNRTRVGRRSLRVRPSLRLPEADWRRYYDIRNRAFIARVHGTPLAPVRLLVDLGAKVALNVALEPRRALAHARLTTVAYRDGIRARLGPTVPPDLQKDGSLPLRRHKPTANP